MAVADRAQTSLDEQIIENPALEEALEQRDKKQRSLGGVRKQFKETDDRVKAMLSEIVIDDTAIVRVGRFRITKSPVPSRSVAFDTDPTSRIRITAVDSD